MNKLTVLELVRLQHISVDCFHYCNYYLTVLLHMGPVQVHELSSCQTYTDSLHLVSVILTALGYND